MRFYLSDAVYPDRSKGTRRHRAKKVQVKILGEHRLAFCFKNQRGFIMFLFHFIRVGKCPPELFWRGETACSRTHLHIRLWDIYIRLWDMHIIFASLLFLGYKYFNFYPSNKIVETNRGRFL